jgi:hypothetical protein
MKIHVKFHEKCDRKLKSITFFTWNLHRFQTNILGSCLKGPIIFKRQIQQPKKYLSNNVGIFRKRPTIVATIETRAVKLEIFELENLKFTDF